MKNVYGRLAFLGIKNNSKLYVPYILTCVGTVMMFYVMCGLSFTESIVLKAGARTAGVILAFGIVVIGIFAVIFLFYTNSFLVKRREKELGLYNVLGMNKKNITKILSVETLTIAIVSIVSGILLGTVFLALSKMLLAGLLGGEHGFEIELPITAVIVTVVVFASIFALLLIYNAARVGVSKPISLVQSGKGEKPPKANFLFAIIGALILGYAYYQAVTIENPLDALNLFFIAVVAVIIGTYILFTTGSVAICRLLQKKKNYYYKPNHFVSVSTLLYRMRKNGAGLATICVLCTMVLVMLTSTGSMYLGKESNFEKNYPHSYTLKIGFDSDVLDENEVREKAVREVEEVFAKHGYHPGDPAKPDEYVTSTAIWNYKVVSEEEMMTNLDLDPGAVSELYWDRLGGDTYKLLIVDADLDETGDRIDVLLRDLDEVSNEIYKIYGTEKDSPIDYCYASERWHIRQEFYGVNGGLFFLGIVLSILFLCATVLIIYYKQITEGYEDRDRFAIMKKVGMNGREIKKTVNSQVLTVFFAPLLAAGVHLLFAFPFVYKILTVLEADDKPLLITANVLCYLCFAALYMLVYKRTSRSYIKIVDAQTT